MGKAHRHRGHLPWIRQGDLADTLRIARTLLKDEEDLIHKAVGGCCGGRQKGPGSPGDVPQETLPSNARTMLRYAIERFPGSRRQDYLRGKI